MTVLERNVEQAVASEQAVADAEGLPWFRGYLRGLLDGGLERAVLEEGLKTVYLHLRDGGNEPAADLVLDGLDLLTAWCGPGMAIPEPQTV